MVLRGQFSLQEVVVISRNVSMAGKNLRKRHPYVLSCPSKGLNGTYFPSLFSINQTPSAPVVAPGGATGTEEAARIAAMFASTTEQWKTTQEKMSSSVFSLFLGSTVAYLFALRCYISSPAISPLYLSLPLVIASFLSINKNFISELNIRHTTLPSPRLSYL